MFLGSWHPVTSTVYDSTCMSLPSQHLDCTQAIRKINKERGKLWEFGCLDKEKICESFRCLNKSADSMSLNGVDMIKSTMLLLRNTVRIKGS